MPMTLNDIVEEVRHWPREQVTALVDQLSSALQGEDPTVEAAWRQETRRRIAEIKSGAGPGIPGEEVAARIRRIVSRRSRISSIPQPMRNMRRRPPAAPEPVRNWEFVFMTKWSA